MTRIVSSLALLTLVACAADVGEGKVQAEVADVPAAEEAKGAAEAATALKVDVSRSTLRALGAKITATHPIDFDSWRGTVAMDGDQVAAVEFEVDVASLRSDSKRLDGHLKKEDFLFVDAHPQATFKSASIAAGAEGEGMTHTVSGDLTIRGKTKRVTFPAKIAVAADAVSATTEFTIDRQDFEVTYPGKPDDLVQDNVVLTVELVAPRAR